MLVTGSVRLLRDASMWLDEAAIAYNLLNQSAAELFGPYLTGHNFPRLYMALINGAVELFGYHTMVMRLLPFLAFAAGAIAWHRLGYLRFRNRPMLLAVMVLLCLIPGTGFAYGAMLKQYSLDVLLALVPFLLPDAFFDRHLRQGREKSRLVALPLLALFSFSYLIPLAGRTLGWFLAGLRRGERRLDPSALAVYGGSTALAAAGLWWLDLRHTTGQPGLLDFWAKCLPTGSPSHDWLLLDRFVGGWYRGNLPLGSTHALPTELVWLLIAAMALGGIEAVRRAATSSPSPTGEDLAHWGSRSLGALVCIVGTLAAGFIVHYPLCPGRITLFTLFFQQLLIAEGLWAVGRWLGGGRRVRIGYELALLGLVLLIMPTAYSSMQHMITRDPPENIRPLLHFLDREPETPVLVASCSNYQIETLPEFLDRPDIEFYDARVDAGLSGFPDAREFFVIMTGTHFYCPWFTRNLNARAEHVQFLHNRLNTASLLRVRMPVRDR